MTSSRTSSSHDSLSLSPHPPTRSRYRSPRPWACSRDQTSARSNLNLSVIKGITPCAWNQIPQPNHPTICKQSQLSEKWCESYRLSEPPPCFLLHLLTTPKSINMSRKFFVGGNWKMNGSVAFAKTHVTLLNEIDIPPDTGRFLGLEFTRRGQEKRCNEGYGPYCKNFLWSVPFGSGEVWHWYWGYGFDGLRYTSFCRSRHCPPIPLSRIRPPPPQEGGWRCCPELIHQGEWGVHRGDQVRKS